MARASLLRFDLHPDLDLECIDPAEAVCLRIFHEETGEDEQQWTIDAASSQGYTEAAWSFDTFAEAVAALPAFAAENTPHLLEVKG